MTSKRTVSVELEVPFHDVDSIGVVWHGHYYKYLEIARTALFRSCALDAPDFLAMGLGLVVIETFCRHMHPLRYGDRIRVDTWFKDVENRLCVGYEIIKISSGKRVARGQTKLVTVDASGNLLLETPTTIRQRIHDAC